MNISKSLHPFCNVCGWRKGGLDSWDGKRCKCGHYAAPLPTMTDDECVEMAKRTEASWANTNSR